MIAISNIDPVSQMSTEALKNTLLELVKGRDTESLSEKVLFYKNELEPFFEELQHRNPFPTAEEQLPIVLGVWSPVWSTIPFQDTLPGRIHDQSYQVFHDNGFYANIARYAPGHQRSFLQKLSSILLAFDFMIVQKFEVQNGQWLIQNVGIEQAFRLRGVPLDPDRAEHWFTAVVRSQLQAASQDTDLKIPELKNQHKNTAKKLKKVLLATPKLEHLYIDNNFRLIKTQREAKQRPSYTVAVRKR